MQDAADLWSAVFLNITLQSCILCQTRGWHYMFLTIALMMIANMTHLLSGNSSQLQRLGRWLAPEVAGYSVCPWCPLRAAQ